MMMILTHWPPSLQCPCLDHSSLPWPCLLIHVRESLSLTHTVTVQVTCILPNSTVRMQRQTQYYTYKDIFLMPSEDERGKFLGQNNSLSLSLPLSLSLSLSSSLSLSLSLSMQKNGRLFSIVTQS